jgi:hypothetical protein
LKDSMQKSENFFSFQSFNSFLWEIFRKQTKIAGE